MSDKVSSLENRRHIEALRSEVDRVETFAQSLKSGQDAVAKAIHQQCVRLDALAQGQGRILEQLAKLNERADNLDAATLENIATLATATKQIPAARLISAETTLATVRAEVAELKQQIGAEPRAKDLQRASVSDMTPAEIERMERGYGLRGQVAILMAMAKRNQRVIAGGATLLVVLEALRALAPLIGGQ